MRDQDLLELIEILREIPKEHWELFNYIRQMEKKDIDRLKDLVQPAVPLPREFADTKLQEDSPKPVFVAEALPEAGICIEDLRKFL